MLYKHLWGKFIHWSLSGLLTSRTDLDMGSAIDDLSRALTLVLAGWGRVGRGQHIPGKLLDRSPVLGVGETELGDSLQLVLSFSHELERPFQLQGEGREEVGE